MRRLFQILMLGAALAASACNKPAGENQEPDDKGYLIIDWAPVVVSILAYDNAGKSIISPEMPGMSLTFKGETYTVTEYTKEYVPYMFGLLAIKKTDGDYYLGFGEIDGAADMDEDLVLNWPDGSTDTIHYHCSDHKNERYPSCNRSWKLNGEDHGGDVFVFTGKSLAE